MSVLESEGARERDVKRKRREGKREERDTKMRQGEISRSAASQLKASNITIVMEPEGDSEREKHHARETSGPQRRMRRPISEARREPFEYIWSARLMRSASGDAIASKS
eukprot:3261473-Rhodomonas_salina.3